MKRTKYFKKYMRKYRKTHKRKWNAPGYKLRLRLKAMDTIGGPECANCGCDKLEILEINHINGGGNKDLKNRTNQFQFYREIYKDLDAKSKYNVLCRPCNALHYVQDILKIKGHKITWSKPV